MGTNFYWQDSVMPAVLAIAGTDVVDGTITFSQPGYQVTGNHIGKRSAAGLYCWDCDITLCKEGKEKIHYGETHWYERCPKCNKVVEYESGIPRAVGIELGFVGAGESRPQGVASCSSFSWAQDPELVGTICRQLENLPVVMDEYDHVLTGKQFIYMLACNCPIQFTDSIGADFC